jgi:release factor glutamine methyltransferase
VFTLPQQTGQPKLQEQEKKPKSCLWIRFLLPSSHPKMTIAAQIASMAQQLGEAYAAPEAAAIARRVIGHRLGLENHELLLKQQQPLDEEILGCFADDLMRLLRHEPVQYVLGTAPFLDLELEVASGVLIPRPETEELVQLMVQDWRGYEGTCRIADVGTGSGCIAVALGWYLPQAEVAGIDISEAALAVARRNAARYSGNVMWIMADIFGPMSELFGPATLDVLVSNPPYVPLNEFEEMARHVRDHEPALALFVPDDDPLRYYARLAEVGNYWLRSGGLVYLETHTRYAAAVAALFTAAGYAEARVRNDFTGRPRFVTALRP